MHPPQTLSSRQKAILRYIAEAVRHKGYPPSVREIGQAVGLSSTSSVHFELTRLVREGYLLRDPDKPRALRLSAEGRKVVAPITPPEEEEAAVFVPLVGKVTAGVPITAVENIETYLPLPRSRVKGEVFLLRVEGDSMIRAGILDGDLVVVNKTPEAEQGDIVVALTPDDEATVKRLYRDPARDVIRLVAENPNYPPLELKDVQVLGKVIGVIRWYP
ncbi:MAG: transcriptional repressor LexA [Hydrogenibacillus sp.]|nr:transcriptional repressor LexA [Hydrogenibacillus sp.]